MKGAADAATSSLLEGRGLTAWRGENLLFDELDVRIGEGEVLQLAGPNGSGKSTLLRTLVGLAELDEGEVLWRGRPTRRVREAFHAELLYLGHKPGISGALDPRENLRALLGPDAEDDARVTDVLLELGLGTRLHVPCRALSAGQQRRVALARLRLQTRTLWLLDEPLTALDAGGLAWVRERIVERALTGGAVIYTTHQPLSLDGVEARVLTLGEGIGRTVGDAVEQSVEERGQGFDEDRVEEPGREPGEERVGGFVGESVRR